MRPCETTEQDMELTIKHKHLLLFLSTRNPLLRGLVSIEKGKTVTNIDKAYVCELTGISPMTISNWSAGGPISPTRARRLFTDALDYLEQLVKHERGTARFNSRLYEELRDGITRFAELYGDASTDVHDAAQALGLPTVECQKILDEVVYDRGPLLPAAYYPAPTYPDLPTEEFDTVEGQYVAWLGRGKDVWLQAALHVRYLQELGDGRFIRCKMNFPILQPLQPNPDDPDSAPPKTYWEYDGVLVVRSKRLYWTFEKRQRQRNDYLQFITQRHGEDQDGHPVYAGQYLTTGQDREQTIVSGPILLRWEFSDALDRYHLRYRQAMRTSARVLSTQEEIAEANALWAQLGPRHAGQALMP